MSLPQEIIKLQEQRTKLEDESRVLNESRKNLEDQVKTLEQKISEELKNNNEIARQTITRLESMVNELEQKLSRLSRPRKGSETADEAVSKNCYKKCTECGRDIPFASEECQHCNSKQSPETDAKVEVVAESGETISKEPKETSVTIGLLEDQPTPR